MRVIVSAGLGQVGPAELQHKPDNEIIDHGHGAWGLAAFQVTPIFAQRFIPSIMQAIFNAPVTSVQGQKSGGASLVRAEAGDALGE